MVHSVMGAVGVTQGPGILQRQVASVLVVWVLRVQVRFFKIRRKSFGKESESIPAANYFWVIMCACVRAGCGTGCRSQAIQEGGREPLVC